MVYQEDVVKVKGKNKLRGLLDEAYYQGKNDTNESIYRMWRDKRLDKLNVGGIKRDK